MNDPNQGVGDSSLSYQPVALRWTDFDQQGHIYHAKYLELLDEARTMWLQTVLGDEAAQSTVVVHISIDYLAEVTYEHMSGERFEHRWPMIGTRIRVRDVGTKSVTTHEQVLLDGGKVSAAVKVTILFWDREHRRTRVITPQERETLSALMEQDKEATVA